MPKPRKTTKFPNLQTLKQGVAQADKQKSGLSEDLITEERQFEEEDLRKQWNVFAEEIRKEGRETEYMTMRQDWRLVDDYNVLVHLANSVQELSMEKLKQDLTLHLRKKLQNKNIFISWEVEKNEHKKMLYTNSEKFEHLAEKNPELRNLKQRLDLDTDF